MEASALAKRLAEVAPFHYLKSPALLEQVVAHWCERQRVWHGPAHLLAMVDEIMGTAQGPDRDVLLLAAIYHDAIYDPRAGNNETLSAELLRQHSVDPHHSVVVRAADLIVASSWSSPTEGGLAEFFFQLDTRQLSSNCSLAERAKYERAIFREYQFAAWATYRERRREFLEGWRARFPQHREGVGECLELLSALEPRIALYPGSFNPFHLGHLSILRQAEASFDKVIVGVGINRQKTGSPVDLDLRLAALQDRLRFHEVAPIPGLVTSFVDRLETPVTIVRGVRDGTDLEAELRYARFLNELRPGTNVLWISCEPQLQHLSSSSIRELDSIEPGAGGRYIPETEAIYDLSADDGSAV